MMQDNKALQAGTSHNLGQNFAKAFDLKFQTEHGEHGVRVEHELGRLDAPGRRARDDARRRQRPAHAAAPRADRGRDRADLEDATRSASACSKRPTSIVRRRSASGSGAIDGRLRVHLDAREGIKPGAKYYEWELRGVPLRMELGPRDLDKNQATLVRRDTREKTPVSLDGLGEDVADTARDASRTTCSIAARERREANSIRERDHATTTSARLMEGEGGFVYAGWCGDPAVRGADQGRDQGDDSRAPRRGVPLGRGAGDVPQVRASRRPHEVVWAKAY